MIYSCIFIIFIITLFAQIYDSKEFNCLKVYSIFFFSILLAILVGINSDRADYINYLQIYKDSPTLFDSDLYEYSKNAHTETGYNYFQALLKTFFNSATFFFIVLCFISLLFRKKFYTKFSNTSDILIIFFAFLSHEFLRKDCVQIRNGIASAIVLCSFIPLYKNNIKSFLIMVAFACSFQLTAIAALPLLLIQREYTDSMYKRMKIFFTLMFLLSLFLPLKDILLLLNKMGLIPARIAAYLSWTSYLVSMKLTNPLLLKQIMIILFVFFFCKNEIKNRTCYYLFQIYLLSTVYYLFFRDFEILAARFGSLFYGVEPLLLLEVFELKGKNKSIRKIGVLFFYFLFFIYNYLTFQNMVGWKIEFN